MINGRNNLNTKVNGAKKVHSAGQNSDTTLKNIGKIGVVAKTNVGSSFRSDSPKYESEKFELDNDPSVLSFLYSLDGAGKDGKNPTNDKQWEIGGNPFLKENVKEFFYDYLEIKDEDKKRIVFVKEGK